MRHQVTPSSWCLPFTSVIGLACLGAEELGLDDNQEAFAKAMLQQSRALGTLVSHLVSQADGSDPSLSSLSGASLGSRRAAKRERLQGQLAARSGSFLLQVSQQALPGLTPSEPIPTTRAELTSRRFGPPCQRAGTFACCRCSGTLFFEFVFWCFGWAFFVHAAPPVFAASEPRSRHSCHQPRELGFIGLLVLA